MYKKIIIPTFLTVSLFIGSLNVFGATEDAFYDYLDITQKMDIVSASPTNDDESMSPNLFLNGDFEDTGINLPIPMPNARVEYSQDFAKSGTNSLKVTTLNNAANQGIGDSSALISELKPGKKYYFSSYIRSEPNVAGTISMPIFLHIYDVSGKEHKITVRWPDIMKGQDFVLVDKYFTLPNIEMHPTKKPNIVIASNLKNSTFYLDDIELRECYSAKPVIAKINLEDGMKNINTNFKLNLSFKVPVDPTSVNVDTVYVSSAKECLKKITDIGNANVNFTFEFENFEILTDYTLVIDGVKSPDGMVMNPVSYNFTTGNGEINCIKNGDFEDTTAPLIVGASGYSNTYYHSGSYSAVIPAVAWPYGGADNIKMENIIPEETYSYSAWVRLDPSVEGGKKMVVLNCFYFEGVSEKVQNEIAQKTITAEDGFVELSGKFTVPKGKIDPNKKPSLLVVVKDAKTAYYLDDVVVKNIPSKFETLSKGELYNNAKVSLKDDSYTMYFNADIGNETLSAQNFQLLDSDVTVQNVEFVNARKVKLQFSNKLKYNKKYELQCVDVKNTDNVLLENIKFKTVSKFSVGGIKFFKDYDKTNEKDITDTGLETGEITAVLDYKLNEVNDYQAITMLYKDGNMVDITLNKVASDGKLMTKITVPDVADGNYFIKIYIIDNFNNIQPLTTDEIRLYEN